MPMIRLKTLDLPLVVQSPMANCTDLPFRLIARSKGMQFAFLEMISSEALIRSTRETLRMMQTLPEEQPVGCQLVGCDAAVMGEAAATVEAMGFATVDMNLGCPVPKIVSNGGGSQLLREPDTARRIFTAVVRAVRRIPVTVKMRLGYRDASGAEAAHIARIAQDCGVDAIAVHGRTREQGYTGVADYEAIGRVKQAVSIPVFGNGDVVDGPSAVRLRRISGCDGVMVGRGALGNPWLYRELDAALADAPTPAPPTFEQRKATVLEHIALACRYDERPLGPLRRVTCWYFRDLPGVKQFRDAVHRAQTVEEIRDLVAAFVPYEPSLGS